MQRKTDDKSISALTKRVLRAAPGTPPRLSANMSQGEQSARSARYAQRVARQEKRAAEIDSTNNKQGEVSADENADNDDDNEKFNEGHGHSD